jgi:6-phosphogluconolactonase
MVQPFAHVYVGNAESNDISVFHLDRSSGALTPIETVPIPTERPGLTTPLAISPDQRVLFAGVRSEPYTVASFAMDPDNGRLTHIANGPLADTMPYIVTDKTGRFLLSASYHGNKIAVNPIRGDGSVGPPQQIIATDPKAHAILPDPANRYVFVPCLGGDVVHQFRFEAQTGQLSWNDPRSVSVKKGSGPRHFRFHPNGKYFYLANETAASLYVFDYDGERGLLGEKQVVSFVPPGFDGNTWASDLQFSPNGRFLYAAERNASTLAGFSVDPATGLVRPIGFFPTEKQPRGFKIDPTGRFLLSTGQLSRQLSLYAIDGTSGALTRLSQYPVGQNPNWVEIVDRDYPL